ncbi:hypothetical protein VPHK436_0060 [Vibrio phage K436]
MKEGASVVTVALPVLNEVTQDGVVTALRLEETVIMGLTWGAWFKIGMFIALVLLIIERALSIWVKKELVRTETREETT